MSGAGPAGDTFSLAGRRILITGASSGLGRAAAQELARAGAVLQLSGRDAGRLEEAAASLEGSGHTSHRAALPEDAEALAGACGELDGVLHAAGVDLIVPAAFAGADKLAQVQRINYEAPLLLMQALLRSKSLRDGASVVFVTSIAGRTGTAGYALYAGSKGGLAAAARALAVELAGRRIRVNCLAPGFVETPMTQATPLSVADKERYLARYPLGPGAPEDVAQAARYLLAPASRWVTGTELVIDGGASIRHGL